MWRISLLPVFLLLTFFLPPSEAADPELVRTLLEKERFYTTWQLPDSLPMERVAKLVEQFAVQEIEKIFLYLGDERDFNHGHLLFTADKLTADGRLTPFAILYHTQEAAHGAHWDKNGDKKFDYVDVRRRNWVQWLDAENPEKDGVRIVNARDYLKSAKAEDLKPFFDEAKPERARHYTIHSKNLDAKKLGYDVVGDLQIYFDEVPCATPKIEPPYFYAQGPVMVALPCRQPICLRIGVPYQFLLAAPYQTPPPATGAK